MCNIAINFLLLYPISKSRIVLRIRMEKREWPSEYTRMCNTEMLNRCAHVRHCEIKQPLGFF